MANTEVTSIRVTRSERMYVVLAANEHGFGINFPKKDPRFVVLNYSEFNSLPGFQDSFRYVLITGNKSLIPNRFTNKVNRSKNEYKCVETSPELLSSNLRALFPDVNWDLDRNSYDETEARFIIRHNLTINASDIMQEINRIYFLVKQIYNLPGNQGTGKLSIIKIFRDELKRAGGVSSFVRLYGPLIIACMQEAGMSANDAITPELLKTAIEKGNAMGFALTMFDMERAARTIKNRSDWEKIYNQIDPNAVSEETASLKIPHMPAPPKKRGRKSHPAIKTETNLVTKVGERIMTSRAGSAMYVVEGIFYDLYGGVPETLRADMTKEIRHKLYEQKRDVSTNSITAYRSELRKRHRKNGIKPGKAPEKSMEKTA